MLYEVLRVDTNGKSSLCYIPSDFLHERHDIYAPINIKYHNISLAVIKYNYRNINTKEQPNDTINTLFPEYGNITDSVYLILDQELDPLELERQYKKLIADVAYKCFL
jgi:hypothetical protein